MKSIVLYYQPNKLRAAASNDYSSVKVMSRFGDRTILVRAEVADGDVGDALLNAKPRKGEVVLNTVATR